MNLQTTAFVFAIVFTTSVTSGQWDNTSALGLNSQLVPVSPASSSVPHTYPWADDFRTADINANRLAVYFEGPEGIDGSDFLNGAAFDYRLLNYNAATHLPTSLITSGINLNPLSIQSIATDRQFSVGALNVPARLYEFVFDFPMHLVLQPNQPYFLAFALEIGVSRWGTDSNGRPIQLTHLNAPQNSSDAATFRSTATGPWQMRDDTELAFRIYNSIPTPSAYVIAILGLPMLARRSRRENTVSTIMTRRNQVPHLAAFASPIALCGAIAQSGSFTVEVPIDPATSSLLVSACDTLSCAQASKAVSGSFTIAFNDANAPTQAWLHGFSINVSDTQLVMAGNGSGSTTFRSYPAGQAPPLPGMVVSYRGTVPFGPVNSGATYTFQNVPTRIDGTASYASTGDHRTEIEASGGPASMTTAFAQLLQQATHNITVHFNGAGDIDFQSTFNITSYFLPAQVPVVAVGGTLRGSVTPPPPLCPGDANGDSQVNSADLSVLLGQFGAVVAPDSGADYNGDGVVNSADLSVLLSNFGNACSTTFSLARPLNSTWDVAFSNDGNGATASPSTHNH